MKKFLLSMAVGAMAFTAAAAPVFAAEGTGKTNIGYTDGAITDPDNPVNPEWSVSIPKDFIFVKDSKETQDMTVKLNQIGATGLATTDKVQVDVASANSYKLNGGTSTITSLEYTLKYGIVENTNGKIGDLESVTGKDTISGTATLPHAQLTQVGVEGTYTDVLTYTVHSAVAK